MPASSTILAPIIFTGITGCAPVADPPKTRAPHAPGATAALPASISATFAGNDAKAIGDCFLAEFRGGLGLPPPGTAQVAAGDTSPPPVVPTP